ncbi:hypothetical protein ASPWEDRAFT_534740 [Aspergillus wentii DTO 134E9]|uniref:OPT family small oligopeptide transporter n=1 Tax=Aspergillus wentii DTO 134E9 TaxID=1073089 RepID=A0A1L9RM80_ASPWE|nr:uncharacterized protein ASPWEDRAFT_534740 [Aspergillus wentii DTO 134E9]KAI9929509.1 hypothetical protein MW887_000982 [Aspergillus wentii]OJJ36049.1 hypothetical protein ASPWEDRAFT_534740 [Aspergillus wentii DTO 134E9]
MGVIEETHVVKDADGADKTPARPDTASEAGESLQEVLKAAGVDGDEGDDNAPCLTLRMWILGIAFCILGSGLNTLYTFRKPSITLAQSVIQLLAFPLGKLWEKCMPDWKLRIGGWTVHLNPGPFNSKENILVFIMANLSFLTRLSADVLTEQQAFYGYHAGWGFQILITMATFLVGFCLPGLFRSIIVEPADLLWPGILGVTALNKVLHKTESVDALHESKWKMSRYAFFSVAFCASFVWYWFPDFIFPALSYFTFPCWIKPNNPVVNQIFGMTSGMGLLPLTFDWSQIAYVGSPLLVPSWAIINVGAGLVLFIWIIATALYYTNTWYTAYLPYQSSSVFDNTGSTYNVSRVVNKMDGYTFNNTAYEAYSPIYMPITYALNMFGMSFATLSTLVVWMILEKHQFFLDVGRRILAVFTKTGRAQRRAEKATNSVHPEVPMWWYFIASAVALFLAIFSVEYWDVQLRWYGVLLSVAVAIVFYIPLAVVYATANLKINIDVFCRIVAGFVFEGKVLANIWFFDLGYITTIKGLYFAQDLKLGIYCKIPPRQIFLVQIVGIVVGTVSQVSVVNWALGNISGICTTSGTNGFTCPFSRTHFNTSMIWGAVGPRRFFATSIGYDKLLYFFILGALLPIPVFLLKRRYPQSFWSYVHIPLFIGGLNYIPPATGTNYGSWAIVGLIFGWWIRRNFRDWWRRYNFVLSSAMDCSVSLAGVVIFFAIFYSGASKHFKWWGTNVYKETCDYTGCPYLTLDKGETFGP